MSTNNAIDTNIIDLDPNTLADIFGTGTPTKSGGPHFLGRTELGKEPDLLQTQSTVTDTTQTPTETPATTSVTDSTTQAPVDELIKDTDPTKEADILIGKKEQAVDKDKPFDVETYYQDRLKSGKFVKIETENEKGEKVLFIPKTFEELDEVIDLQLDYSLEQKGK